MSGPYRSGSKALMARKNDSSSNRKTRPPDRSTKSSGRSSRPGGRSRAKKSVAPTCRGTETYWQAVRKPVYALVFLLPMIVLYETGVAVWGQEAAREALTQAHQPYTGEALRVVPDTLIQVVLGRPAHYLGWPGLFFSGSVIVVTLIIWQIISRQSWSVKLDHVVGMTGESVLYASFLLLPYVLVGYMPLKGSRGLPTHRWMDLFFDLGAGVYEEFIFRFALMGLIILLLVKFAELDRAPAGVIAALVAAIVFASAHHIGPLGEPFALKTFSVRTGLGLFFGGVFITRGFGVAAGTHVFYNILVGMAQLNSLS